MKMYALPHKRATLAPVGNSIAIVFAKPIIVVVAAALHACYAHEVHRTNQDKDISSWH
jgi:hypothetical protein